MGYDEFSQKIKEAVVKFNSLSNSPIRIIGHLDADGISATCILINALNREDCGFSASLVMQLDKVLIDELVHEDYKTIFFVDVGSEFLYDIEKKLGDRDVFILDHHQFDAKVKKVNHLNPRDFGLDYNEVSGAGITYLFCKILNRENEDLAHLAIIGAMGDMQHLNGIIGINKKILDDAIKNNKIEIDTGITLFGAKERSLYKLLEYNIVPYIPGVTGSEKGALNFLKEQGIEVKKGDEYRKLNDLDEEEMKRLITGITLKRLGSDKKVEGLIGTIYTLTEENLIKDIREFIALLNACGRLNKPSLGIASCLGNEKIKEEALAILKEYRKEVINSLNWFYNNKDKFEKEGFVIINAENNIRHSLTGVLAELISKSNFYKDDEVIIVMARTLGEDTKISVRVSGDNLNMDVRRLLKESVSKLGDFSVGGHIQAAGAMIPIEKEEDFLRNISKLLLKAIVQ